jgi:hypothetical protein
MLNIDQNKTISDVKTTRCQDGDFSAYFKWDVKKHLYLFTGQINVTTRANL